VLRRLDVGNLNQLADGMGVAVSTASRLADRLVTPGLVDRGPSPRSRREVALTVTARGAAILDRYDDLRLVGLRGLLTDVPPGRRDGVLDALALYAGAAGDRVVQR